MVLNQLQDLNMAQNAYHAYCTTRFQDLGDQLHNVHDLLSNFYNRDNPRDEWMRWLIGHALHFNVALWVSIYLFQFFNWLFFYFNRLIISVPTSWCTFHFYFNFALFVFVSFALIHLYVTALMKIFIFPNYSTHLLSFDESKGGEKWVKLSKIELKLENLK